MQEAAGKLSRDMIKSSYRAFAKECRLCIELLRQFYTEPRLFRVAGTDGGWQFLRFDGGALQPRSTAGAFGLEPVRRSPAFDITVAAVKKNTVSQLSQNENARALYQLGVFDPANAAQASALLELMDFEGVERVRARVAENAAAYRAQLARAAALTAAPQGAV